MEHGSHNIFADLGLPNPEAHLAKAQLVVKITDLMKTRGLKQVEAAWLCGLRPSDMSELVRGQGQLVSVERLRRFLVVLGQEVEIV